MCLNMAAAGNFLMRGSESLISTFISCCSTAMHSFLKSLIVSYYPNAINVAVFSSVLLSHMSQ